MDKFEILLLLVGIAALAVFSQMPPGNVNTQSGAPNVPPQSQTLPNGSVPAGGLGTFDGVPILARFSADSFKIVDGDSIRLMTADAGEVDLRMASIDAPEWNQTGGQAAKRHFQSLTAGRRATFLQTDTDRYKRAVVFMFVDPLNSDGAFTQSQEVNAQMIADGFAWHAIKYSSSGRLNQLEAYARAKRLGLWADPHPQPPWEYRDRK